MTNQMQRKANEWLLNGETGCSSRALCAAVLGINPEDKSRPYDPDDFSRCLGFLNAVPEARQRLHLAASLSLEWAALVARWDEVEASFLEECGIDWQGKRWSAPKTYALMQEIFEGLSNGIRLGKMWVKL